MKRVSNSVSDKPWGCSLSGSKPHQVDDVDHPYLERREFGAQDVNGGQGLERRDIPTTRHDHVRVTLSFDAQSQAPIPRVQCKMASSIER